MAAKVTIASDDADDVASLLQPALERALTPIVERLLKPLMDVIQELREAVASNTDLLGSVEQFLLTLLNKIEEHAHDEEAIREITAQLRAGGEQVRKILTDNTPAQE